MKKFLIALLFSCLGFMVSGQQKLVWSDEFNKPGLPDTKKWIYDTGDHGWGNQEKQNYTGSDTNNAVVRNGALFITARKTGEGKYSSARLLTKNKGDWKYGRIEIRAKLPKGLGLWPAIWMLPTDWKYGDWPNSGEIDIMEHVGHMPDSVFTSIHTESYNHIIGTQKTRGIYLPDTHENYHIYSISWQQDNITFLIDGKAVFSFANEKSGAKAWPFDQRFHLLLNIAVGGTWGGQKGIDDTVFPQYMEVDYVRVYQ